MAHEITRSNFFDTTSKPAWHRLSIFEKLGVIKENRDYTAKEVYALFGNPEHSLAPLSVQMPDGSLQGLDQFMILRHPLADDPQYRQLGIVSKNYELTDGGFASGLWDEHIGLPVETMMLLKDDGVLVITAKLPDYDIKGEGIVNYLVFQNGMNGRISVRSDVSATRVVCANTLAMAQSYSVNHSEGAIDRITAWMADVVAKAHFQNDVMREVYGIMAKTKTKPETVREVANIVYVMPSKPSPTFGYKDGYDKALENYQAAVEKVQEKRLMIVDKFRNNSGIGFDSPECKTRGTMWEAMNIFSEDFTHSRTSDLNARSASLLMGQRLGGIQKSTALLMKSSERVMGAYQSNVSAFQAKFSKRLPSTN